MKNSMGTKQMPLKENNMIMLNVTRLFMQLMHKTLDNIFVVVVATRI